MWHGMAWVGAQLTSLGTGGPLTGPGLIRQEALAESGAGVSFSDCKSGCQGRESSQDPGAQARVVPIVAPRSRACIPWDASWGSRPGALWGRPLGVEGSFAPCLAGPLVTLPPPQPPQGGCATFLCQPLDVLKTRLMNSRGEYQVSGGLAEGPGGGLPTPRRCQAPWPGKAMSLSWDVDNSCSSCASDHILSSGRPQLPPSLALCVLFNQIL